MIIVPDDPGPAVPDEVLKATVTKVFDGDGFLAKVWHPFRQVWVERVPFRFAFVDAPEMEQPFGPDAQKFLDGLIAGTEIRLDPVGKASTGYMPIDPYKRVLCMAFLSAQIEVGRVEYYLNGQYGIGEAKWPRIVTRNVELEMIVNGWAWVTEQYTFDRETEYFDAQDYARKNQLGLWSQESPEPPWNFKRRQKRRNRSAEGQGRLI